MYLFYICNTITKIHKKDCKSYLGMLQCKKGGEIMGINFSYSDDKIRATMPRNERFEEARHYMHTHETAELYYFIAGKTVFHIEGTEYIPERGDILFIRPAESHYTMVDNSYPYERAVINFDIDLFDSIDPDRTLLRPLFERKAGKLNLYKNFRFKTK